MTRRFNRLIVAAAAVVLGLCSGARAAYHYEFDQANYEVEPGATVDVRLFLVQDGGSDLLTTEGLFTATTKVEFEADAGNATPALIGSVADIVGNPGFSGSAPPTFLNPSPPDPGRVDFALAVDFFDPFVFPDAGSDRILLMTITFTGGAQIGGQTLLLADLLTDTAGFDNIVTGAGTVLDDETSTGRATITVVNPTAIPEPASLALVALGLPVGLLAARRRGQRA